MTPLEQAARPALEWAERHGEVVFAGGGMAAADAMNAWATAIRAALEQLAQKEVSSSYILVNKGVLQMVVNALIRDAKDGKAIRGEMADELLATVRDPPAEAAYALLKAAAPPAVEQEPFGYFRPEPSGWVDCEETAKGAIALYKMPQPAAPQTRQPLTTEQYTQLAHRIASRYSHRSDPQFIAYTFLPHTLEQFVRAIEYAISNQQPMKLPEQKEPQ